MRHAEILSTLVTHISKNKTLRQALFVPEFEVLHGRSRVDLALLGPRLAGFEIKSQYDSLRRYSSQLQYYFSIFDYIYVVCDNKHLLKIEQISPKQVGILTMASEPLDIKVIRHATINKEVKYEALIKLLWREELVTLAKEAEIKTGISKLNKNKLSKLLIEKVPFSKAHSRILELLQLRQYSRQLVHIT